MGSTPHGNAPLCPLGGLQMPSICAPSPSFFILQIESACYNICCDLISSNTIDQRVIVFVLQRQMQSMYVNVALVWSTAGG